MADLNDIERALAQLLMARGVVSNDEMLQMMKHLKQEYPHCDAGNNYDVTFGRLNRNLRRMGLEVKSVVGPIETDGKTRMVHHGIINNTEDSVSTEHGSAFSRLELDFIRSLLQSLVREQRLSGSSVGMLKPEGLNAVEAEIFAKRLVHDKWLLRNDLGYYEIGLRSYLELRAYIETCIRSGRSADDEVEAVDPAVLAKEESDVAKLPQIMFY